MTMKRFLLTAVLAAAVAVTGSVAKADFVIDNFTTPSPASSYTLGTTVGSIHTATDVLPGGITRKLTVTLLGNDFFAGTPATGEIGTTSSFSRYSLSTATGATAFTSLAYSYTTAQDYSVSGTILRFTFLGADLNVPFSVIIGDGTTTSTVVGVATAGPGIYSLPLSGFSGVNLANVQSVTLVLNENTTAGNPASTAVKSADITLTDVRVTTPDQPAVPAPPAAILLLAAAPVLGLARIIRRRRATEVVA